jgi:hypothetical protein
MSSIETFCNRNISWHNIFSLQFLKYGKNMFYTTKKSKLSYDRRSVCPGVRVLSGPVTSFSFSLQFSLDICGLVIS